MNRRNVEVDFLEKIQEITGIQVFSSVDLQYMNAEDLEKERCVSRTLATEIVEKYKKEHDEENNRVYEQVNIYKNTISFVFIGDSRHVQKTLEFFEHIQGRGWWIARNGFKYVIENVGRYIYSTSSRLYRKKCSGYSCKGAGIEYSKNSTCKEGRL